MAEAPPAFDIDVDLITEVFKLTATEERAPLPRHRHNLTRSQVEISQRARIMVATVELVTELGYAATSSKAIIERAGVSSKTFYALFGDKESAFFAAFALLDGVIFQFVTDLPPVDSPIEQAKLAIRAFLEQLAAVPLFTRMRLVEGPAAGRRALERQRALNHAVAVALAELVREGAKDDPAMRPPSSEVMLVWVGGLLELLLAHILEHGTESLPSLEPTLTESLHRLVYGEPATPR